MPSCELLYAMIQRRALAAGIKTKISCHSFRATVITTYLQNDGKLEIAQQMAGHESARTHRPSTTGATPDDSVTLGSLRGGAGGVLKYLSSTFTTSVVQYGRIGWVLAPFRVSSGIDPVAGRR